MHVAWDREILIGS